MELTGGLGADVAIEAVGLPETFELCTELVRPGGRVANVGVHGHSATLHLETLWIRDLTITMGLVDTFSTPRLLELVTQGKLNTLPFATHHFPLGETMGAYDTFADAAKTNALKVVLTAEPVDAKPRAGHEKALVGAVLGSRTAVPVDVILRDGSTLRLRAPASSDAGALVAFFERLSEHSRYLRFHGARRVDAALVEHFLDPDWIDRGALIGVAHRRRRATSASSRSRSTRACATRRPRRSPSPSRTSFRGAALRRGCSSSSQRARQRSASSASSPRCCRRTRRCSRVFRDAGFEVSRTLERRRDRGSVPDRTDRAVPRARRGARPRRRRRVAPSVLRARRRRGDRRVEATRLDRRRALSQHHRRRLRRRRVPREPRRARRSPAYARTARSRRSPIPVDLAVICVPGGSVLESAEEALRKGVRALCVISAGFAEVGAEGAERQEQLLALVRAHGARLVGPNCLGIAVPALGLNATFAPRALPAGRIAFSSQSGALGLALLEKASERGLGFSAFVSIGNKADVSSNDLLEWWEEDEDTDVVLLYLESFGNPQKFARVAGRARPPQADPRAEGGDVARRRARSELAHRRARRAPTRRSKRSSAAPASCARATSRSSSTSRRCSRASRFRAAGASPC